MGMRGSVWERWKNRLRDSALWEHVGEVITFKAIGAKPGFLMHGCGLSLTAAIRHADELGTRAASWESL